MQELKQLLHLNFICSIDLCKYLSHTFFLGLRQMTAAVMLTGP